MQSALKNIDFENKNISVVRKQHKYRISVPMLYITFMYKVQNILVYLKSGSGSKKYKAKNEYVFIFYRRGTNKQTTTTAVFPGGSKKRKSSKEDEALTGRS